MKNIFPNRINDISELTIDVDPNCEFPISIELGTIPLCDKFKTKEEAEQNLQAIMDFYNNELWHNYVLLCLMVRYTVNIRSFNNEGWKRRLDEQSTPDGYKQFILGIESAIRCFILETINTKFTNIAKENTEIYPAIMERMKDRS
jgi:hypothetical protein